MQCPRCGQTFEGNRCPTCGLEAQAAPPKRPIFRQFQAPNGYQNKEHKTINTLILVGCLVFAALTVIFVLLELFAVLFPLLSRWSFPYYY